MKNKYEINLRSEMYNHDNEKIIKKSIIKENKYDYNRLILLGIFSFIIILIVLIIIIILTS